ncbi:MAG: DUF488 domain-containing protein [Planctomycetota bacterium]
MNITIKRIYEPVANDDGVRVLVDRVWPRGVSKDAAEVVAWCKAVAPSTELRKWFAHDPAKWPEFVARYHTELDANPDGVAELLNHAPKRGRLTLVYSAKDEAHNQAAALRDYLIHRFHR